MRPFRRLFPPFIPSGEPLAASGPTATQIRYEISQAPKGRALNQSLLISHSGLAALQSLLPDPPTAAAGKSSATSAKWVSPASEV
jgi:hypothetical protein